MLDNTILQIEVEKIFTIQLKNKISPDNLLFKAQIATTVTKLIKLIFNKVISIQNSRSNPFLRN